MQINSFQYYLPVNLIFGPGKTEVLGEEAARYGKKVMIVTGRRSTKRSGSWIVQSPCLKGRDRGDRIRRSRTQSFCFHGHARRRDRKGSRHPGHRRDWAVAASWTAAKPSLLLPAMRVRSLIIITGREPEKKLFR